MVHGLDAFKEYFADHTDHYVFIGGTACALLMDELGASFRVTKDLDMVLIIEALDRSFGQAFWAFIEDGGYGHRGKSEGTHQFYRFSEPDSPSFPKMIELFSRLPGTIELRTATGLTPIHIDDSIVSLSAILLSDVYYETLCKGKRTVDGFSVLGIETVLLFKIKAWLDMKRRREAGEHVDSRNIRKHKNDVFRLLPYVTPSTRVETAGEIQKDVIRFAELIRSDTPDWKSVGMRRESLDRLLDMLQDIFL